MNQDVLVAGLFWLFSLLMSKVTTWSPEVSGFVGTCGGQTSLSPFVAEWVSMYFPK